MSGCVGIDVHRKRSQVAVVAEDGRVQVNRNVTNGVEPMNELGKLFKIHRTTVSAHIRRAGVRTR